jgi:two-component system, LytTR family, response regulator
VNKVSNAKKQTPTPAVQEDTKDHLFVNVQKKKVKILFDDILYIESQREYIKIVTAKGAHLSKISTHEIEDVLPASQFKRIHRSFIVSVSKITSYTAEDVEVNGTWLPIGRGYKDVMDSL